MLLAFLVEGFDGPLGCNGSERFLAYIGHLIPVHIIVEPDTDPVASANVRRSEKAVWLRCDRFVLNAQGCGTPEVRDLVAMMTIWPEHPELLSDEECRRPVTEALRDTWQRPTNGSDPAFDIATRHQERNLIPLPARRPASDATRAYYSIPAMSFFGARSR
jgi:hypothetical protein